MLIDAIIDTDPGVDDAFAIFLALKSDRFRVHALTTVAGNATIEDATANARFLLELLEREDIPIYSGAEHPLARDLVTAPVHGEGGLAGARRSGKSILTGDAPQRIVEMVRDSPRAMTIIALGPLTNVARAIQIDPAVMSGVRQITMMGGAFSGPGNMPYDAEFNIYVDPEAADIVFRFPVPKTLIPLEACDPIRFSVDRFDGLPDGDLKYVIVKMIGGFIEELSRSMGDNDVALYDPLTVYFLMNPGAYGLHAHWVEVGMDDSKDRGRTRSSPKGGRPDDEIVHVARRIDGAAFDRDFIEVLKS